MSQVASRSEHCVTRLTIVVFVLGPWHVLHSRKHRVLARDCLHCHLLRGYCAEIVCYGSVLLLHSKMEHVRLFRGVSPGVKVYLPNERIRIVMQVVSFFAPAVEAIKILRGLRVLRIAKTSLQFRMLLSTVMSSMGTIGEIIALMGCIMLSYSFIGMNLFQDVRHGSALDRYQNFEDFPSAAYTLSVVCFNEWVLLLQDLEVRSCSKRTHSLKHTTETLMAIVGK